MLACSPESVAWDDALNECPAKRKRKAGGPSGRPPVVYDKKRKIQFQTIVERDTDGRRRQLKQDGSAQFIDEEMREHLDDKNGLYSLLNTAYAKLKNIEEVEQEARQQGIDFEVPELDGSGFFNSFHEIFSSASKHILSSASNNHVVPGENEEAIQQMAEQRKELEALQLENSRLTSSKASSVAKLSWLTEEDRKLRECNRKLEENALNLEESNDRLKLEILRLKESNTELEEKTSEFSVSKSKLEEENSKSDEAHRKQYAELQRSTKKQYSELQKSSRKLEKQNSELQKSAEKFDKERSELKASKEGLAKSIVHLEDKNTAINKQNHELRILGKRLQGEIEELKRSRDELKGQLAASETTRRRDLEKALEERHLAYDRQLDAALKEKTDLDHRVLAQKEAELDAKNVAHTDAMNQIQKTVNTVTSELKRMACELESTKKGAENQRACMQSDLDKARASSVKHASDLRLLEFKFQQTQNAHTLERASLSSSCSDNAELRSRLAEQRDSTNKETSLLRQKLEELRTQHTNAEKAHHARSAALRTLQEEKGQLSRSLENLKAQHEDLKTRYDKLDARYNDIQTEKHAQYGRLQSILAEKGQLRDSLDGLTDRQQDLDSRYMELEALYENLKTHNKDLETCHEDLKSRYEDLETRHSSAQEKKRARKAKLESAQKDIEDLSRCLEDLETRYTDAKKAQDAQKANLKCVQEQKEELHRSLVDLKTRHTHAEKEKDAQSRLLDSTQKEKEQLHRSFEESETRYISAQQAADNLHDKLQSAREENEQLDRRLEVTSHQLQAANVAIDQGTAIIRCHRNEIHQLINQNHWYRNISRGACKPAFFYAIEGFLKRHTDRGVLFDHVLGGQLRLGCICILPQRQDAIFIIQSLDQSFMIWQHPLSHCTTFYTAWTDWLMLEQWGRTGTTYIKISITLSAEGRDWIASKFVSREPTDTDFQRMALLG